MRYALTGATGFVGGRLAELLVQAGHTVIALVRDPAGLVHWPTKECGSCQATWPTRRACELTADGADGLFHVAGWYQLGARDDTPARRVNVDGTRAVLAAVRDGGAAARLHQLPGGEL